MNFKTVFVIAGLGGLLLGCYALCALALMYLWNSVIVSIFGLQPLTYQLAFDLFILLSLTASIFKGSK